MEEYSPFAAFEPDIKMPGFSTLLFAERVSIDAFIKAKNPSDRTFNRRAYIQKIDQKRNIEEFTDVGEMGIYKNFPKLFLNDDWKVGYPALYGFRDLEGNKLAFDYPNLVQKLKEDFKKYRKFPFLQNDIACFINEYKYIQESEEVDAIRRAIDSGEMESSLSDDQLEVLVTEKGLVGGEQDKPKKAGWWQKRGFF